jgi:NADH-quinone oxidoreductase subunit G
MRVWFLKQTPGIDPESSVGANTEVWSREGVIYRITPRQNDAVNDTWMSDSGRMLYKQVKAADRLLAPMLDGHATAAEMALKAANDLLKHGSVAIVGSGRSSVEEQFLTKKLADALKVSVLLVSRVGQGDRLLISSDHNPNVRGALVTGLIAVLPSQKLTSLAADIDAGKVKTVFSVGEDLTAAGITAAQLAKVSVIYLGTHKNATSDAAKVVIPTLTIFEKSGTFVNQQFRLQKFAKAVPGPAGVADDLVTLSNLASFASRVIAPSEVGGLWAVLAAEVKPLAGLTYGTLPATGLPLDASAWAGLPYCEGETLHFKPAAVPAVANA